MFERLQHGTLSFARWRYQHFSETVLHNAVARLLSVSYGLSCSYFRLERSEELYDSDDCTEMKVVTTITLTYRTAGNSGILTRKSRGSADSTARENVAEGFAEVGVNVEDTNIRAKLSTLQSSRSIFTSFFRLFAPVCLLGLFSFIKF